MRTKIPLTNSNVMMKQKIYSLHRIGLFAIHLGPVSLSVTKYSSFAIIIKCGNQFLLSVNSQHLVLTKTFPFSPTSIPIYKCVANKTRKHKHKSLIPTAHNMKNTKKRNISTKLRTQSQRRN